MSAGTTKARRHEGGRVEGLRWHLVDEVLPDSDTTVLVFHKDEDEPVGLGFHDGECWRQVDGARAVVSHWAVLPEGPV